jgi:hypothetical protein
MTGRTWIVFVVLLACSGPAVCQPDEDTRAVQDILDSVKRRAADQQREDRRRALLLLQQAQRAEEAGQISEAHALAQKAAKLFADSEEIRGYVRHLGAQQKRLRDQAVDLAVIRQRFDEAVDHARELYRKGESAQARELLESVKAAGEKLPAEIGVVSSIRAADALLKGQQRAAEQEPETLPMPQLAGRSAPANPAGSVTLSPEAWQRVLQQRVRVDWRSQPFGLALSDLTRLTGVTVGVDEALTRTGLPTTFRVDLQVYNGAFRHVLDLLSEKSGARYVIASDSIIFTTKQQSRLYEQALPGPPQAAATAQRETPLRQTTPEPLPAPARRVPPPRTPDYLRSGKAFQQHIDDLIREAAAP